MHAIGKSIRQHITRGLGATVLLAAVLLESSCDPPTLQSLPCTHGALYAADDALGLADDEASTLRYANFETCKNAEAKELAAPAAAGAKLAQQGDSPSLAALSAFVETRGTSAYAIDVLARRYAHSEAYDAMCGELLEHRKPALALRCFGYRQNRLDAKRGLAAYAELGTLHNSEVTAILELTPAADVAPLRQCFAENPIPHKIEAAATTYNDNLSAVAAKLSLLPEKPEQAACLRKISRDYCLARAATGDECPQVALSVVVESLLDSYQEPKTLADLEVLVTWLRGRADRYRRHPPLERKKANLLDLHRRITIASAQLADDQIALLDKFAREAPNKDTIKVTRAKTTQARDTFVCLARELTAAMRLPRVTLARYLDPKLGPKRCNGKILTFSRPPKTQGPQAQGPQAQGPQTEKAYTQKTTRWQKSPGRPSQR